jgi:hypothetical protein
MNGGKLRRELFSLLLGAAALCASGATALDAGVITYAGNPTGNSTDFATGVAGIAGTITTYTFDTLATGALASNAYAGLTLNATGEFTTISNGAGPGQSNISSPPVSPGEGVHSASNYLGNNDGTSGGLTVDFSTPVVGAGIFTIDVYNPSAGSDNVSLSAYSGLDGTGTLLGTATGAQFNFQANNLYFLGITSSANNIQSVVFNSIGGESGDIIGLDNLEVATSSGTVTPEPGTILMGLSASLLGLAAMRRRRAR